jgi:hypothetical protein
MYSKLHNKNTFIISVPSQMNCGRHMFAVQIAYGNRMQKRLQFNSAPQTPTDVSAVQFDYENERRT